MIMKWPKYDEDKPIRSCCFVSLAVASSALLAVSIVSAVLIATDLNQHRGEAGISLIVGFIIGPIVLLAGLPWSFMSLNNNLPVALSIALLGASVLINALLIGFAIGVARAVRGKKH